MEKKLETHIATSSRNNESDGEAEDAVDQEDEEEEKHTPNNNVQNILKKLQSSGALLRKPKQEHRCITCDEEYPSWEVLENHLIQHVSLPSVVLDKLPSDDEDTPPSGDENWSDEEEESPPPKAAVSTAKPKKLDISQLMKMNLKQPAGQAKTSDAALSKLSGLGFTIKKNTTPIKKEPEDQSSNDVMNKLGKLGGIKLKLKSDGNNTNSFKVINGLKDFKASDEEDEDGEGSGNEERDQDGDDDEDQDKSGEQDSADEENEDKSRKNSESDDDKTNKINKKIANALKNLQGKSVQIKTEPLKLPKLEPVQTAVKTALVAPVAQEAKQPAKPGRPAVKQTPKRGANLPLQKETNAAPTPPPTPPAAPERRESRDLNLNNVVVKQEVDSAENQTTTNATPLFSTQIKSERTSPPITTSTPTIASVKSEPDTQPLTNAQPLFSNQNAASNTTPLLAVTKKETQDMTIIEINGDSGDDDDDCCVVSATPAPDVKPVIPKTENPPPAYPPPAYPASTLPSEQNYSSTPSSMLSSRLSSAHSTEKQHNFNWNAPDSKPHLDILEKSTDEIFESLLSSATKKERDLALSDASEYISIDTLGPQHTCAVCNTRFTEMSLLEEHKRMTGHSMSLMTPSASSSLLPYNQSSNILSSLLPVKQLAEQVGKLSGMGGSAPGFTHQQNVMINIQAYPGAGGTMGPPQPYNSYPPGASAYPQTPNNMYGAAGQQMPGQYPGQHYMNQPGYGQYQPPMSKAGYPGSPNSYASSTPYSTASPLQNMQQAYGPTSASMMNTQAAMGQMGPPVSMPNQYAPASSPGGTMKPPAASNVRIQNVQTFAPGQLVGAPGQEMGPQMAAPGQMVGGQMPSPSQIRMAPGATVTGARPRMPTTVRGARPSIRPGIQVHGQVRGGKVGGPRMPIKRPGGVMNAPGQKQRRPDMLLPGKHDNEDCQVMAMQKQRDGLPMIQSVQGAKDKLNLGSQISITKKTVNREANDMARALASRGISVKQKQKSRSPSPERPVPRIPNLGAGVSIKHANKSSNFSIPEAKVGGGMLSCRVCKKMFMNHNSLQVHMTNAHPQSKIPMFRCDECPASYPKSLQLQHHKRVFHNVSGPNRELGLPVVDLSQEDNLKRLSSLGIYSFIPLANREQASGCFGIPVVSVHNSSSANLQALGADGLLSLGPLKSLPNS
ncbi:protein piccolo [Amyelois transitella]|uniref:protein piccolo n=1 Tax=Amyelois transitella TaxID=680683 RepID=UPI0029902D35|nr:protein piccolo [Amyelois transitella]